VKTYLPSSITQLFFVDVLNGVLKKLKLDVSTNNRNTLRSSLLTNVPKAVEVYLNIHLHRSISCKPSQNIRYMTSL